MALSLISAISILMRPLATWQVFLTTLCCLFLFADSANASDEKTAGASSVSNQALAPLTIDERYSPNDIPAKNTQGTLTLHGAVEEAAAHNRDVLEAGLQVSRYKWDHMAKEVSRLPNIRAISYLSEQTIPSTLVPAGTSAFVFLSALFPVTQQYRLGLEAKAIKFGREIAAQRLRQRIDETRAQVKQAYYKLALDESLLDDVQDSIKHLLQLQKTVSDQAAHGDSLKVEVMEVAARLAKERVEETKATNDYNVDRETFNHLLGRNLSSTVRLETIPPPGELELNVDQAEQRALSMRPEIQEADLRVKQLRVERKVIMSEYIPNVSVGVVYIALPGFNNAVVPNNILAPGFFMNWNAFDWGRKVMLAKAHAKVEQGAQLTAQSTREEVLIDLHKQINKVKEARQSVEAAQLARAAARERIRVSMNRYKYTAEKLSDVLQAQSGLSDEYNKYHQALLAFWDAMAQFDRAIASEQ